MKTIVQKDGSIQRLYSAADIAKEIGRSAKYCHYNICVAKIWPEATVCIGSRLFYTEPMYNTIIEAYRSRESK